VAGAAWAQTMTEVGAAAATGAVGGVAGKKVSDGLTAIFEKVDEQTKSAAKDQTAKPDKDSPATAAPASPAALPQTGPAPAPPARPAKKPAAHPAVKASAKAKTQPEAKVETRAALDSVPDPPPPAGQRAAVSKPSPPAAKPAPAFAPILPPPPPLREVSADDLKNLNPGTVREDVLKLGPPAWRITMFDDGHLLEIYSYMTRNTTLGVVRLSDGAVSRVELR